MKHENNPLLSFYEENRISPVHQDITDFGKHLARREKLYRSLGLPPMFFSNSKVLEVGPGGGFNALALFSWGASVDFVEPNPTAQFELQKLLTTHNIDQSRWKLFNDKIEAYTPTHSYDIVLAEGFLPGLNERSQIIQKLGSVVQKGGVVVVTCIDDVSFLMETVKRLVGTYLLQKRNATTLEEKVTILSKSFSTHLGKLKNASRPVADWVTDNFLNPALLHGKMFSIGNCIEEFGEEFAILGSSPSLFTDLSWYKDIDFDQYHHSLKQFKEKQHLLLLKECMLDTTRPVEANEQLEQAAFELRQFFSENENVLTRIDVKQRIIDKLRNLSELTHAVDSRISMAIDEAVSLILDDHINEEKIAHANHLASAIGKGQQYVSLVKKFTN